MDINKVKPTGKELMRQHGLIQKGWKFRWMNRSARIFGQCNYREKKIFMNRALCKLNDEKHVFNTILHEIAHALAPGAGHGAEWVRVARSIGCDGQRCYSAEVVKPPMPIYAFCSSCGHEHGRYGMPRRAKYCGPCHRQRNAWVLLIWKRRAA